MARMMWVISEIDFPIYVPELESLKLRLSKIGKFDRNGKK